jgi:undecaprenyl-diphosphatase
MLYDLDVFFFRFINEWHQPEIDAAMIFLSNFKQSWVIAVLALLFIIYKRRKETLTIVGLLIPAIGLADFIASPILKPLVQRMRPCYELEGVRLIVEQGNTWSFASSHAANTAAFATILWIFFANPKSVAKQQSEILFAELMAVYAALVAYSRVYVGVHYPSDVLAGSGIGILSGVCVYGLFAYIWKNVVQPRRLKKL